MDASPFLFDLVVSVNLFLFSQLLQLALSVLSPVALEEEAENEEESSTETALEQQEGVASEFGLRNLWRALCQSPG